MHTRNAMTPGICLAVWGKRMLQNRAQATMRTARMADTRCVAAGCRAGGSAAAAPGGSRPGSCCGSREGAAAGPGGAPQGLHCARPAVQQAQAACHTGCPSVLGALLRLVRVSIAIPRVPSSPRGGGSSWHGRNTSRPTLRLACCSTNPSCPPFRLRACTRSLLGSLQGLWSADQSAHLVAFTALSQCQE